MRSLILCVLVSSVSAAPTAPASALNFTITLDFASQLCTKAKAAVEAKYVPAWVVDPVCAMSDADKQAAIDYVNKYHTGGLATPKSTADFIKQAKTEAPGFGAVLESIYNQAKDRWSKLTPPAQEFVRKWENASYSLADPNRMTWFTNVMGVSKEFLSDYKALSKDDIQSFREQFPEYMNCYEHNPKIVAFRAVLEQLDPKFDFKGDPETMEKLFNMSIKPYLPAASN